MLALPSAPLLTLGCSAAQSHAGKIVTRGWYERNKHIFPASRWEVVSAAAPAVLCGAVLTVLLCCVARCSVQYDPSLKFDKYTIR